MPHTPAHKRSTYVGLFDDRTDAEKAAEQLRRKGLSDQDFGYAWRDERGKTQKIGDTQAGEYGVKGAVTGGAVGGAAGAAMAAGLIPGVGPVLAGGILASAITGAAAGAAAGGIGGALIGMGIPDEEAKFYEEEF